MKRAVTLFTALAAFAVGSFASTAQAGGHKWGDVPPHGHVMLIGVEVSGGEITFNRCVEFKALRVPAHHDSIHTGKGGGSPMIGEGALFKAGNWVIPLAPITEFKGCESFTGP